jgi:CRISPR-associated protein Csd1
VSFNQKAFWSYGWENNENAPVCEDCASGYATALNRCLSAQFPDPKDPESKLTRQAYVLTESLTAVYWSDDSSSGVEAWAKAAVSDPDQAKALLSAPYHGGVTSRPLRFYCLLLQGAQGRATVRSYHSELISKVHQNLRDWFEQIAVRSDRVLSLLEMLAALAIRRKSAKLPPNLTGEIYLAILFGFQIPRQVVQLAVSRNRAEADVSPGRAALLQAWLGRKPQSNERTPLVTLDPDYPSTGYQLGRLLAVCEQIQYKASDGKVNKSITDRFFPALSSRPLFVFSSLMRLSELRLAQIRRRNDSTYLKRKLGEIIDKILPGEIPSHLSLEEQAKFALGYYHQYQANFTGSTTPVPPGDVGATDSSN